MGKRFFSRAGMLAVASASGQDRAQASEQLQRVFTGGSNAVPVGGWATLAATVAVVLAAYLILRRLKVPGATPCTGHAPRLAGTPIAKAAFAIPVACHGATCETPRRTARRAPRAQGGRMTSRRNMHWGAALLALASEPLHAQSSAQLQVLFTGGTNAVPVGGWSTPGIALALAVLAYLALKKMRTTGRVAAILATSVAVLATWSLDGVERAWAPPSTPLPLATSPATIAVPTEQGAFMAMNVTPGRIRITGIVYTKPVDSPSQIYYASSSCVVGMALAPGAYCMIFIVSDPV